MSHLSLSGESEQEFKLPGHNKSHLLYRFFVLLQYENRLEKKREMQHFEKLECCKLGQIFAFKS